MLHIPNTERTYPIKFNVSLFSKEFKLFENLFLYFLVDGKTIGFHVGRIFVSKVLELFFWSVS